LHKTVTPQDHVKERVKEGVMRNACVLCCVLVFGRVDVMGALARVLYEKRDVGCVFTAACSQLSLCDVLCVQQKFLFFPFAASRSCFTMLVWC
jgi:hypothetical protein